MSFPITLFIRVIGETGRMDQTLRRLIERIALAATERVDIRQSENASVFADRWAEIRRCRRRCGRRRCRVGNVTSFISIGTGRCGGGTCRRHACADVRVLNGNNSLTLKEKQK